MELLELWAARPGPQRKGLQEPIPGPLTLNLWLGPLGRWPWQGKKGKPAPVWPSPHHQGPFSLLSNLGGHRRPQSRGDRALVSKTQSQQGTQSTPTRPVGRASPAPHLTAVETNPGLLAIGEHLPQCDPKHPGITGMGEGTCLQALRSTPGRGRGHKESLSEHAHPHQPTGH